MEKKRESRLFQDRKHQEIYYYFEKISQIPRESGHEGKIAEFLIQFAEERKLEWFCDEYFNVLIKKPASPGAETMPPVLLECHSDMVCVKKEGVVHDFRKDPIVLVRDGTDILRADGTSLGADNGCGVAICLALLDRENVSHPPLECFFAAQEETGLVGAAHFDTSRICARRVIGLDAGSYGVFCKGTTTKHSLWIEKKVRWMLTHEEGWLFEITGLQGGYPALCFPMERVSAITAAGEVLCGLGRRYAINVGAVQASSRGIPESCRCEFMAEADDEEIREYFQEMERRLKTEYRETEPGIRIILKKKKIFCVMDRKDSLQLARLLALLPCGVFGRNVERMDLILGYALCKEVEVLPESYAELRMAISTDTLEKYGRILENIKTVLEMTETELKEDEEEAGWIPAQRSRMRDTMQEAFRELFGREAYVKVSHGGNDCVELYKKIPDLDIVTTAADYINFHTPNEYLILDTFEREYELVERTLEKLCGKEK